MNEIIAKLSAPFPPAKISWRVGPTNNKDNPTSGIALAYIDARDVQDRLDEVCGVNWQSRYPHAAQKTVCEIGIKIDGEWYWRADGAGDTDMEAEKGSLSDAFKRAAVKWGVGRYLYDVDSPWVDVVKKGKSVVIAEKELPRLQKLLPGSKVATAKPEAIDDGLPQPKNEPGVSKARQWVANHLRELHGAESPKHLMEMLVNARAMWVRIKSAYPGLWSGPDGSGLRGEALKCATIYEVRDEFDQFVASVELHAENKTQAAE